MLDACAQDGATIEPLWALRSELFRFPFSILHSPFSILHSPFSILQSPCVFSSSTGRTSRTRRAGARRSICTRSSVVSRGADTTSRSCAAAGRDACRARASTASMSGAWAPGDLGVRAFRTFAKRWRRSVGSRARDINKIPLYTPLWTAGRTAALVPTCSAEPVPGAPRRSRRRSGCRTSSRAYLSKRPSRSDQRSTRYDLVARGIRAATRGDHTGSIRPPIHRASESGPPTPFAYLGRSRSQGCTMSPTRFPR